MVQTNWTSLGRPPAVNWGSSPSVARTIDGRLEVFVLDSSGALWHIQQTTPGMNWNSWASLSIAPNTNVLPGLVVERNADGRLEIFALDSAGALWHTWQTSPGGGWFHWFSSGSPPGVTTDGPLTVAQNADGRLEVFAIAESRSLWHIWQTTPNGTWSGWTLFDGPPGPSMISLPFVARNADGRLEAFLLDPDQVLWHIWQVTSGGSWGNWDAFDTPANLTISSSPSVVENADGRLEAFVTDFDQVLWHAWQVTPGGPWGS